MAQLSLYVSHSVLDNAFSQRLAWALRGAGADVWFDSHVVDEMRPGWATLEMVRNRQLFLQVLSPAALDSTWVWEEYSQAMYLKRSLRPGFVLELAHFELKYPGGTTTLTEMHGHSPWLNVIAAPLPPQGLPERWQPQSEEPYIGLPGWQPYPEREAIERTVQAVAELVPSGEQRVAYAQMAAKSSKQLPWSRLAPLSPNDILELLPQPLVSNADVNDLIARGKALSEDAHEDSMGSDEEATPEAPSIWCLVANVASEQRYGKGGQEVRHGTKHFAPGAKVYCMLPQWGDGYEDIKVIGHHRGSHRFATLVMPSKRLTNWRADLVYSPYVIREMEGQWDGTRASKQRAEEMAAICREREVAERP